MFVPKFTCPKCQHQYTPQMNPDGTAALGLCPVCPQADSDAWTDLVQQQRLERERRRNRR